MTIETRFKKEKFKEFEKKKAGLERRIANGFKWPTRNGTLAINNQFNALEKEIGSSAMDDIEKAAYIYHTYNFKDGEFVTWDWGLSQEERKYYKACIHKLEEFGRQQAYEAEKTGRKKAEVIVRNKKQADDKRGGKSAETKLKQSEPDREYYLKLWQTEKSKNPKISSRAINDIFYTWLAEVISKVFN